MVNGVAMDINMDTQNIQVSSKVSKADDADDDEEEKKRLKRQMRNGNFADTTKH